MKKGLRFAPVLALWLVACGAPATPPMASRPTAPRAQVTPTLDLMEQILSQPTSTPTPTPTPEPTIASLQEFHARVNQYLTSLAEQGQFSGSVLIAKRGSVLLVSGYGLADREHTIPNTPRTRFRIYSVTKQFTAMAILILQHQGKLRLQDPICSYVPDCSRSWAPITIHHLLTHTAGLPQSIWPYLATASKQRPITPEALIARFKDVPLDFRPGTQWRYSDLGYLLLGYIIERVSGKPYGEFLTDAIFRPLHLASTGYFIDDVHLERRAVGYVNASFAADDLNASYAYATGGLNSTVEDLYAWAQALETTRLVPKPLLDKMFTPYVRLPEGAPGNARYGYGWLILDDAGRRLYRHDGGGPGYRAVIGLYPDQQVTIIVLSNLETTDMDALFLRLERFVFEGR